MIKIGDRRRFTYPNYGTPDGYPSHTAHSGQVVEVVAVLPKANDDPDCEQGFTVRAKDGWEGAVYKSELGRRVSK